MAIRGSSLAGPSIPVGGPAGLPGQGAYAAWLALGNTGELADFMAAQRGADGKIQSFLRPDGTPVSKAQLTLDDIGALPKDGDASGLKVTLPGALQTLITDAIVARAQSAEFPSISGFKWPGEVDDAMAFQRAADTRRVVRVPWRADPYVINQQTVTIDTGQFIVGEMTGDLRPQIVSTLPVVFRFVGQSYHGICGFNIDMTGSPAGSSFIRYGTNSGLVIESVVRNVYGYNCYSIIDDEVHATNYAVNFLWQNIRAVRSMGTTLRSRRSRGFAVIDGIHVDHGFSDFPVTWQSVRLYDFQGAIIKGDGIEVGGSYNDSNTAFQGNAYSVSFANPAGTVASLDIIGRIANDTTTGPGILFQDLDHVIITGKVESYAALGQGIRFVRCSRVQATLHVTGSKGKSTAVGDPSIAFDGLTMSQIKLTADYGVGTGVYVINSKDNIFQIQSFANVGYGLVEDTGSDRNAYTGHFGAPSSTGYGNAGGSVVLSGASSVIPWGFGNNGYLTVPAGGARPTAIL